MVWVLSVVILIWVFAFIDSWFGLRKMVSLQTIKAQHYDDKISIIIAARNEEESIEQTVTSLLQQTYSHFAIIVVNDRSTDRTGTLISELAVANPLVKCLHIEELPNSWLGKNHALYKGYEVAAGDYLLFTDADIHFHPETINKALTYLKQERADHLTIAPDLYAKTFWLKAFISFFILGFGVFKRPWAANQDNRKEGGMGIGAFNLVKRKVYEEIGTHQSIRNRPDDDLQLGQLIKQKGYKQRLATGLDLIRVEWYPSLQAAFKGLEKNTFAGLYYSLPFTIFVLVSIIITHLLPFVTLFSEFLLIQVVSAGAILILLGLYALTTIKMTTFPVWMIFVFPITTLLFLYSTLRAVSLTYIRGGIEWRGTFYSLRELRNQRNK
ncbi:glycosyltransferase [Bacillus sp. DJP31]|uniref:glycosyltransferase n=1 Tax=Bacillus sp. DJP31 TaxID=3409789 RepID=UPI003BB5B30E